MKFRKQTATGDNTYWYMILESYEDIVEYAKYNLDCTLRTAISMAPKDGGNVRLNHTTGLETLLSFEYQYGKRDRPMSMLEIASNVSNTKVLGILNLFQKCGPIQINKSGGYCDVESFKKTWPNLKVLEEVIKNDLGFPNDKVLSGEILVLENDNYVSKELFSYIKKLTDKKVNFLLELKTQDMKYIYDCVCNHNIIMLETQALDGIQNNAFIKLFSSIDRKKIIIKTLSPKTIQDLDGYDELSKKHEIIFI